MNIKVHQTASNELEVPTDAGSLALGRAARDFLQLHRANDQGGNMTTTAITHSHRAERPAHDAQSGHTPLAIRKYRSLAKAFAWLMVCIAAAIALFYSFQSAHASGGTRRFALAVLTLGAGGFAALTAHLSVTWMLIWCAVSSPHRSSRRILALKALRLWSPRAARFAVVALGVSVTAISLGNPSRAFAEGAPAPAAVTEVTSSSEGSDGPEKGTESAGVDKGVALSHVTTLGWAPAKGDTEKSTIPSLKAIAEQEPSYTIAFSGVSEALPSLEGPSHPAPSRPHAEKAAPKTHKSASLHSNDTYTVKSGDTLWSIAKRHLAQVNGEHPTNGAIVREIDRIAALNPEIDDVDLIFPGQTFHL